MSALTARAVASTVLAALGGCIASNVVAVDDRLVERPIASMPFAPAPSFPFDGLWESVEITGDAAIALRRIWYVFVGDGTYTAAALGDVDGRPTFQTLNGTWSTGPDGLSLDGAAPVRLERAGDHVRITAATGVVVLRKGLLQ
jgi:hypothetical protein